MRTRNERLKYSYLTSDMKPYDFFGMWRIWAATDEYVEVEANILYLT